MNSADARSNSAEAVTRLALGPSAASRSRARSARRNSTLMRLAPLKRASLPSFQSAPSAQAASRSAAASSSACSWSTSVQCCSGPSSGAVARRLEPVPQPRSTTVIGRQPSKCLASACSSLRLRERWSAGSRRSSHCAEKPVPPSLADLLDDAGDDARRLLPARQRSGRPPRRRRPCGGAGPYRAGRGWMASDEGALVAGRHLDARRRPAPSRPPRRRWCTRSAARAPWPRPAPCRSPRRGRP